MTLFKRRKKLEAELQELKEVKDKTPKIEKLRADLQGHLKENHFGPRLYAQIVENWK